MRLEPLFNQRQRIDELALLLHNEWGNLPPWSSLTVIVERLFGANPGVPFPWTIVALSDQDQLLGTASLKLWELSDHPDKEHWLGEVFVRREWRGRGVGTALIRESIDYVRAAGVTDLYLYTPDQQSLYRRFGWVAIEQAQVNGESVAVMKLATTPDLSSHRGTLDE